MSDTGNRNPTGRGSVPPRPVGFLNIYPLRMPHGEVAIVGDTDALEALRDALDEALAATDGLGVCSHYLSDGEGYEVYALRKDDATAIRAMAAEYADSDYPEQNKDAVLPWHEIEARLATRRTGSD